MTTDKKKTPSYIAAEEAAGWYASLYAAGSQETVPEFEGWLNRSVENRTAWEAIQSASDMLTQAAEQPAITAMLRDARSLPPVATPAPVPTPHMFRFLPQKKPLRTLAMAASLALAIGISGTMLWPYLRADGENSAVQASGAHYSTGIGQRNVITLADGSRITLDTDSAIAVPAWGATRDVRLERGQAFFEVAKDPAHPFIVTNAGRSVEALGTKFTVRDNGQRFTVALLEGKVRVKALPGDGRDEILLPGDTLAQEGARLTIRHNQASVSADWVNGRLNFDEMPLGQIVEEMNRYSKRKIILGDSELGQRPFSGTFTTDGTDALVTALKAYGIARVTHADTDTITLGSE